METKNSRRNFLKSTALLSVGTLVGVNTVNQSFANVMKPKVDANLDFNNSSNLYSLPKLNYGYDALEPYIDKQTMEIHHSKHHNAYVTNLNNALNDLDADLKLKAATLENIFENINKFPEIVRNNAGGHYNHSFFWTLMQAKGAGSPVVGKLSDAIVKDFGTFANFKQEFTNASMKRFGSGWCWLVVKDGKLEIGTTANQDNPLMKLKGKGLKGKPILALDLWEHAYYLKNQNRRVDYINSWWNVVNWQEADNIFSL